MNFTNLTLGLLLSLLTAIGCVSYEKLVKAHGYSVILVLNLGYMAIYLIVMLAFAKPVDDIKHFCDTPGSWKHGTVYVLTGATSIIWFWLTKRTNVASSSVFEIAYVPFLVLIYWLFSISSLSWTFVGGTSLVVGGVLLITWSQ